MKLLKLNNEKLHMFVKVQKKRSTDHGHNGPFSKGQRLYPSSFKHIT